jgi:hypothetical protein
MLALAAAGAAIVGYRELAPSGPRTFSQATSYKGHRPAFEPVRTIRVATQSELAAAVSRLRPGDYVQATDGFPVTGEFVIARRLAPPGAVIDLGSGAGAVRFDYGGIGDFPSVWIHDSSHLQLYGGRVTNPAGGAGISIHGDTSSVRWWGFSVRDTAGMGLEVLPTAGPIAGVDLEGEITRWGLLPERDPHREKGTGLHAANLGDVDGGALTDSRFAIDASDGPGAAVQVGNPTASGSIAGITLILAAERLRFEAREQVAGNGLQLWGGVPVDAKVPFITTKDTDGRAVDAQGVYDGVSMAGVRILYGRAADCCSNPHLRTTEAAVPPRAPWDPRAGIDYRDVSPSPRSSTS